MLCIGSAARNCEDVYKIRSRNLGPAVLQHALEYIRDPVELTRGRFDGEYLRIVCRQGSLSDTHVSGPAGYLDGPSSSNYVPSQPSGSVIRYSPIEWQRLAVALELGAACEAEPDQATPVSKALLVFVTALSM